MSHYSDVTGSGDLDSLPSWVFDHLGEGSPYMTDEVNQSPSSPMEGSPEESPLVAVHSSVEEKANIMTLEELDTLRDTYSFLSGMQIRLPDEGGNHYFYPPRRASIVILNRTKAGHTSRQETRKFYSEDTPVTLRGGRASSFFVSGDEWEIPEGTSRVGAPRVPRTWGIPDKHCNNPPRLLGDEPKIFVEIFRSSRSRDASPYPCYWTPNHFAESLSLQVLGRRGRRTIIFRAPRAMWLCRRGLALRRSARKLGKSTGASSGTPIPAKGVIIGEKWAGESITSSPSKRGKADDGSKGKGVDIGPEGKKKGDLIEQSFDRSNRRSFTPRGRDLSSPRCSDKEKVDKLTLDQMATKLFHVIGQALVLGSSLAVRSREVGEQASLQEGRVASMETKVARLQKVAADLEQQLAESHAREQQANDELARAKSDRDSLSDKFERSGVLVNELREALNKSKEFAVEEFKSSSEFMVAVEDSASKYFGEGFNFCKVQLRRHHPNLAIDLEGTVIDQDLLTEQDEADEENEKEKTGENEGCCFSYYGDQELGDENLW
ncbi:hypothetical protein Acr_29g0010290 [Actinidia rufa]|uniref:Uncharacterized protein n=1 Tax=Actinidia rufa TaxID=165716 RepID=A0A7J0HFG9_9ERIC|nr:hypothetical protein Acr_29g0010290 [Actinidia rufa]